MKSGHIIFGILSLHIVFSQNIYLNEKSINAVETNTPPKIDGNVLDDPAWKNISQTTGFIQQSPYEGKQASEKTIVKIAFTKDHFYLSVVCYTNQTENIIIKVVKITRAIALIK